VARINGVKNEIQVGDKLTISERRVQNCWGWDKKTKNNISGVVIKKYPHFVMLDLGKYRECFIYSALVMDGVEFKIMRADEFRHEIQKGF